MKMCNDCPDPEACLQGLPCWKVREVDDRSQADQADDGVRIRLGIRGIVAD